ncbi:hypothetical protein SEPCBS57363_002746 [Sporothrix epigloea]|uniref:Ubiquitin-like protein smt3 n=1 Tax=Sporothrix epigloea TaxID=1892477 RepID=A0ABP0DHL3_9PEZI
MPPTDRASDLAASLGRLTIQSDENDIVEPTEKPAPPRPKPTKKKKQEVVDSWEDDVVSSGEDDKDSETIASPPRPKTKPVGTAVPPPTTTSNTLGFHSSSRSTPPAANWDRPATDRSNDPPSRRPEKTDAVARRLIAGALGIRAPKMTDERRAYEKAVREAERKRRDESRAAEKQRQEESERQKKAVWDD